MLISNDFNLKIKEFPPNWKRPAKIIDITDTNAKIKISKKVKVINIEKLNLQHQEAESEKDTKLEVSKFNDSRLMEQLHMLSQN